MDEQRRQFDAAAARLSAVRCPLSAVRCPAFAVRCPPIRLIVRGDGEKGLPAKRPDLCGVMV